MLQRYGDLTVFKMAAVHHVDVFWNSNSLTVAAVERPILHEHTKFRQDRSNRCGNIAIFVMAAAAILDFQTFEILTVVRWKVSIYVTLPDFIKIGQAVAEMWPFSSFSKMAAVCHLGFVGGCVFGLPAMNTWWFLSFRKIWLKLIKWFR